MSSAPLSVLLLGWNGAPRAGELQVPTIRSLVEALAPLTHLSVVLPRQPQPPFSIPASTRVTALASLTAEEAAAPRPRPDQRPAAWQRPTAPYIGATETPTLSAVPAEAWTAPAAPYLGATPAAFSSAPAAQQSASVQRVVAPESNQNQPLVAVAEPSVQQDGTSIGLAPLQNDTASLSADELLLNRDDFAEPSSEPSAAEAMDLDQPENDLSQESTVDVMPLAQRATLPEALASLAAEQLPTSDLNYQVIQYARFATRRALLEDFAVIYATDWPTWLAALELRQQTGRPLVLHVHSLAQERATPADRSWALELERLTLRRADLVLAATEELAELLRTRYQFTANRLQVVHPADIETLNTTLRTLEGRPARQASPPFFPPTA